MSVERILPFAEMLDAISRKDKQKVPLKKKAGRKGRCSVPREVVVTIRTLQSAGKSYKQIMEITGLHYDYVRQVCQGQIRADVIVKSP